MVLFLPYKIATTISFLGTERTGTVTEMIVLDDHSYSERQDLSPGSSTLDEIQSVGSSRSPSSLLGESEDESNEENIFSGSDASTLTDISSLVERVVIEGDENVIADWDSAHELEGQESI